MSGPSHQTIWYGDKHPVVGDGADHVVDRVISRHLFAASACDAADFPINGAGAERRTFQRKTFGEAAKVVWHPPPLALVRGRRGSTRSVQTGDIG
jgi:hypothetical protein